jgi:hypothetical protein
MLCAIECEEWLVLIILLHIWLNTKTGVDLVEDFCLHFIIFYFVHHKTKHVSIQQPHSYYSQRRFA